MCELVCFPWRFKVYLTVFRWQARLRDSFLTVEKVHKSIYLEDLGEGADFISAFTQTISIP